MYAIRSYYVTDISPEDSLMDSLAFLIILVNTNFRMDGSPVTETGVLGQSEVTCRVSGISSFAWAMVSRRRSLRSMASDSWFSREEKSYNFV